MARAEENREENRREQRTEENRIEQNRTENRREQRIEENREQKRTENREKNRTEENREKKRTENRREHKTEENREQNSREQKRTKMQGSDDKEEVSGPQGHTIDDKEKVGGPYNQGHTIDDKEEVSGPYNQVTGSHYRRQDVARTMSHGLLDDLILTDFAELRNLAPCLETRALLTPETHPSATQCVKPSGEICETNFNFIKQKYKEN
ncbi:cilia- and flagella-associated protein 251-like [Homarus americanus]|uniref:cilia- and flagella-associated protein 251-like n=1 Tax=Homarus americanus TaxID=6706 RepID=UPI001C48C380|nr:cilia- and flagella-associated protein 251-like [Homarus americanus]